MNREYINRKEVSIILTTVRNLKEDLQNREDNFITVTCNGKEYVIEAIRRVPTHANIDDTVTHWSLILGGEVGNIIR